MSSFAHDFINVYGQSPFKFGEIDICLSVSPDALSHAGAFAFVMNQAELGIGKTGVKQVIVLTPPTEANANLSQSSIRHSVVTTAEDYFRRALTAAEVRSLESFVKVVCTPDMKISSVIEVLQTTTESSAVIILYAASYRDENLAHPPSPEPRFVLREDFWVPHLFELERRVAQVANSVSCYVLLDAGERAPLRSKNADTLKSVPGCGVFGWRRDKDPEELLASNIEHWQGLVDRGEVGHTFRMIDELPEWMDRHKSFIKLQLLERVAPSHDLLGILRSEVKAAGLDPIARLKLSHLAQRADENDLAREVLVPAIPDLVAEEDLEAALDIAAGTSDQPLVNEILARLSILFPGSPKALEYRLIVLLDSRRYQELLEVVLDGSLPISIELRFYFRSLSAAFLSSKSPEYTSLMKVVEAAAPTLANRARIKCASEAIARREFIIAKDLCMPSERRQLTAGTANMLLQATKELLLQRSEDGKQLLVNGEQLTAPVSALVRYLSSHPRDGKMRVRIASFLSVETAGMLGLAVIGVVTQRLAEATYRFPEAPLKNDTTTSPVEELTANIKNILEWLERQSPIILEISELPKTLLTVPVDEVFALLRSVLKSDQDLRIPLEAKAFDSLVVVAVLLAPHSSDPNEDLDILRYAAARYVAANQPQRARDLAEQVLRLARESDERKRLAWYCFADIYHRSKMILEALMGLASAFSIKTSISFEQMWEEMYLLTRIFRDIHLTEAALSTVKILRRATAGTESRIRHELRAKTLELGIRMGDTRQRIDRNTVLLAELTRETVAHCAEVLEHDENISPAAALLAHCIYLSQSIGLTVQDDAISALSNALSKLPKTFVDLIHAVTSNEVAASELLKLAKASELARNTEDIAFDLKITAIAARRFLDSIRMSAKSADAILAIELLADHALEGSTIGTNESPFFNVETAAERAIDVSKSGVRIIFLGLSQSGRLVRVDVVGGTAKNVVYEDESVFSSSKFHKWLSAYPYGYAGVKNPTNLFYETMDGIGVSAEPSEPTILIMDNSLQQIPQNLIMMKSDFAGRLRPMASAPSISWLWLTRQRTSRTGNRKAWISTEFEDGKRPSLVTVAERLKECLEQYEISLNTCPEIPGDMENCELIVVAAHGGILPEGRFMQRLSNDASLSVHSRTLAGALGGSSIVILFVCSGGRVDSHPSAETTVGLVKDLLNQGCSTVIASPWPLDTRVPSHWLPTFLHEFTNGKTIMEASYIANKNVEAKLGDCPSDCLAMNVFGDADRKGRSS